MIFNICVYLRINLRKSARNLKYGSRRCPQILNADSRGIHKHLDLRENLCETLCETLQRIEALKNPVAGKMNFFFRNNQGRGNPKGIGTKQESVGNNSVFNEPQNQF